MGYDPRSWPRDRIRSLTLDESASLQDLIKKLKDTHIIEGRRYALEGSILLQLIKCLDHYAEIYEIGVPPSSTRRPQDERKPQKHSVETVEP